MAELWASVVAWYREDNTIAARLTDAEVDILAIEDLLKRQQYIE